MKFLKRFVSLIVISSLLAGCGTTDEWADIETYQPDNPYFKAALVSLHFITETQTIANVDSAYMHNFEAYNLPVDASDCRDGSWTARSPYDAFDYCHQVTLTIKAGRIVDIYYDELHRDGHGKREDAHYNELMGATCTPPEEAYPAYEKAVLEKQNIKDVEAVSGATYSLYRLRYALMLALIKARGSAEI